MKLLTLAILTLVGAAAQAEPECKVTIHKALFPAVLTLQQGDIVVKDTFARVNQLHPGFSGLVVLENKSRTLRVIAHAHDGGSENGKQIMMAEPILAQSIKGSFCTEVVYEYAEE